MSTQYTSDVPPVTCIVSDACMSFTLDAAEEFGVLDTGACGVLGYSYYKHLVERDLVSLKASEALMGEEVQPPPKEWFWEEDDLCDGVKVHVMTFEIGKVLEDAKWQAHVYCVKAGKNSIIESIANLHSLPDGGFMRGLWLINTTSFPALKLCECGGPPLSEDLDILFSDAAATGEWAYTSSSRVMPHTDETVEEFHTPHDAECHDDDDLEVVYPSELNKKRSLNTDGLSTKSKTKKKFTGVALLNKTLDRIVNVVESSLATSTQTSSRYPSIAECLVKLESILGVSPNDELYVWAAQLFLRDKRRECFMTLPTDDVWLRFLKLEIEMEKSTTGYRG
ncbi:UDP-glycosyltransferase 85A2 [Camellia lanceoleosa]|uniref:UDP-glycosyltransferase 85A2 n=1 Tax=Camellia lanceoleosa TaxID=1840588 RepID=A0ACC0IPD2_9ERIC|nr:UDP-glycosyltransferase 85A2 [Camellia lanceoleosa]